MLDTTYDQTLKGTPDEIKRHLNHDPYLLAKLEAELAAFLPTQEDVLIDFGAPESYGWTTPVMLPSKKAAAAVVAVAAAAIPAAPSRRSR